MYNNIYITITTTTTTTITTIFKNNEFIVVVVDNKINVHCKQSFFPLSWRCSSFIYIKGSLRTFLLAFSSSNSCCLNCDTFSVRKKKLNTMFIDFSRGIRELFIFFENFSFFFDRLHFFPGISYQRICLR